MAVYSRYLMRVLVVVSALVAVLLLSFNLVQAQEQQESGNGLKITPLRKEFILTNSQTESYEIEVTNVSNADINVRVFVNDFVSDNETGNPRILVGEDEQSPYSIKEFVQVPDSFLLKPGETKKVKVVVTVPEDAVPGGYFGVIRFAAGGASNTGNIALNASVSSLLLVSVPGEVTELLNLTDIKVLKNDKAANLFETAPDTVAITLTNAGNTIIKPYGRVTVKDWLGREVYSYEFNGSLQRGNVLPNSSRTFKDPIENIGFIGRYTVEANLAYGEGGGNLLYGTTTFWVVPWRALLGMLLAVIFVIWFATRGIKAYNRRVVERAKRG